MIDTQESITAKLCSFARAYHSNYGRQKIFDDYLAYDMMGREEYEEIWQLIEHDYELDEIDPREDFKRNAVYPDLYKYISPIPISRIAFAESELIKFTKKYGRCQYVICGAGMDTFAFRNDNSDILVFEVDHPDTQRYKLERIRQLEWNIPENVKHVPVDFSKDDMIEELLRSGYDPEIPTFFSILGGTYYLTLPVFEQTIEKISQISKSGSGLVFDFPDDTTFDKNGVERVRRLSEITAKLGEPMLHGFSVSDVYNALKRHDFITDIHETPGKIQKHFFEDRADEQKAFENIHFILAVKM